MNVEGGKIELDYNDPSREKGKSINELKVKVLVLGCKAIMVCGNLPIEDWPYTMYDIPSARTSAVTAMLFDPSKK